MRKEVWGAVVGGLVGHEGEFRRDRGGRVWGDLRLQGEMVRMLLGGEREWVGGGDVVGKYAVAMCKVRALRLVGRGTVRGCVCESRRECVRGRGRKRTRERWCG